MPWQVEVLIGGGAHRVPAAALVVEFRRAGTLQHRPLQYVQQLIVEIPSEAVC
jgi:hypothetical protein